MTLPSGHAARLRSAARLAGLAFVVGCQLNVNAIPVGDETEPRERDAGASPEAKDASSVDEDAAALREDGGSEPPPTHPSCTQSAPRELPLVSVPVDVTGRPHFDLFRDVDCEDERVTSYPSCEDYDGSSPYLCSACVEIAGDPSTKLCLSSASCVPTMLNHDGCYECLPLHAKARACCAGLDVDCRPWPFEVKSKPGQQCARHEDCEPGLVCTNDASTRYAVCTCPEAPTPSAVPSCATGREVP